MGNIAKVIKTILRLKDEMSVSLKKNSEATKRLSEKIKATRNRVKQFQVANTKATAGLKEQTNKIKALTSRKNKESKTMKKLAVQMQKYKDQTGLTSKQIAKNNQKIKEASAKYRKYGASIASINKSLKDANSSVKKYNTSIKANNKAIGYANKKISKYTEKIKKNIATQKEAQSAVNRWGKGAIKSIDKVIAKTVRLAAVMSGAVAALATKIGFSEAMDMEGYKMQLETAVKDTKKAGELMSEAVKFANKTPFETGEVVEATAKMEAYGISSKRWLADVADMAGATNKGIDQATEAMADAVMGEWERLKEFGIRKDMLMAAASKKYGDQVVFNNKGQVIDQIKMQEVLQETMRTKFKGGAEKQAKTMRGLLSTVTGNIKSSLRTITGMTDKGVIRQGSIYEKLKQQIKKVTDILLKWQSDGTITKIAKQVTSGVMKMVDTLKKVFGFVKEHRKAIETGLVFVGMIYTTVKAFQTLKNIMLGVNIVMGLLNGTLAISPLGWVAIGVGLVVGALYLLWRNLDTVKGFLTKTWEWIKTLGSALFDFANNAVNSVISSFASLFDWVKNLGEAFVGFIKGIPLIGDLFTVYIDVFKTIIDVAQNLFGWLKKIFGFDSEKKIDITLNKRENSELGLGKGNPGTPMKEYVKGGIATKASIFGEAGPEIAIPLNKSERSKNLLGKANNIIGGNNNTKSEDKILNFHFHGDVYGFEDFKEVLAKGLYELINENSPNVVV